LIDAIDVPAGELKEKQAVFLLGPSWNKKINSCLANPLIASVEWSMGNLTDEEVKNLLGWNKIDYVGCK
jgi:hypothetical protein